MNAAARKLKLNTISIKLGCSRNRKLFFWSSKPTNKQKPTLNLSKISNVVNNVSCMAVEKASDDPYIDFRNSMLDMVMERKIYEEGDLKELLNWFMRLNSEEHHEVIFRAFVEGTVKLVLQPGEEGYAGAYHMLKHDTLDNITTILGIHVYPAQRRKVANALVGESKMEILPVTMGAEGFAYNNKALEEDKQE